MQFHYLRYLFILILLHFINSFAVSQETDSIPGITSGKNDTNYTDMHDSLVYDSVMVDTVDFTGLQISEDAIDAPIDYEARDSIQFHVKNQVVYLFGEGKVKYQKINLEAAYIEVDLENNTVFARGVYDTSGSVTGKPHMVDGGDEFDADSIKYKKKKKKGLVYKTVTQEGEGILHAGKAKMHPSKEIHMKGGLYTTCDADHPHFYIYLTKAKAIPDDKVVSGPALVVIEDIPTPLGLPFGIFPNQKGRKSGILMPGITEHNEYGFGLENGGYYWGINDYVDVKFMGNIYSNFSWNLDVISNYKKRYKYDGHLNFEYDRLIHSEKGLPDYSISKNFWLEWRHNQDPKAHPFRRFSAEVQFGSSSFHQETNNYNNTNQYLSNTKQSSVSWQRRFPGTPFNLSLNFNHSQNSIDSTISVTLPNLNLSMSRIYLDKRKNIGFNGSFTAQNKFSNLKDSLLFTDKMWESFKNGMKLSGSIFYNNKMDKIIPVKSNIPVYPFSIFLNNKQHFTFNPSLSFTKRGYFKTIKYRKFSYYADSLYEEFLLDTVSGFKYAGDFMFSAPVTTKIYGTYSFKNFKISAIRHVLTPSVAFKWRPDFSKQPGFTNLPLWGRGYETLYYQDKTDSVVYSYFDGGIYGAPPAGKYGGINFNLTQNLEMKVRTPRDSANDSKKISLIDNLTLGTFYNFQRDSLKWDNLNVSARTSPFKNVKLLKGLDIRLQSAVFDFYQLDSSGTIRINKFEFRKGWPFVRKTDAKWQFSINFNLSEQDFKKDQEEPEDEEKALPMYADNKIKWNFNVNYTLSYGYKYLYESFYPDYMAEKDTVQTLNFRGSINLTPTWKFSINSGWDFKQKELTYTRINIEKDLHCFVMSISYIPFGNRQSYHFMINAKASLLKDVKFEKKEP